MYVKPLKHTAEIPKAPKMSVEYSYIMAAIFMSLTIPFPLLLRLLQKPLKLVNLQNACG